MMESDLEECHYSPQCHSGQGASHMVPTPGLPRYVSFEQWQETSNVIKMLQPIGDPLHAGTRSLPFESCDCVLFEEARLLVLMNPRGCFWGGRKVIIWGLFKQPSPYGLAERCLPPASLLPRWSLKAAKQSYWSGSSRLCTSPQLPPA